MYNYIIKIDPEHMPRLVECGELTLEYMQTAVEGPIEVAALHRELHAKHPDLRMIANEEGKLFDLPYNAVASLAHDILRGLIVGPVILVIAEGEELRPMTEAEAAEIRDTIESLYEIEFEEGGEE